MAEREMSLDEIARAIEAVPAWLVKDEPASSVEEIILAAARRSFFQGRYQDLLEQEDRFWGQKAMDLLARGEVPRWVDSRRYAAQYAAFGKASWVELYGVLFHKYLRHLFLALQRLEGPILELGCGCGWLALELARQGREVEALDASRSSLQIARFFNEHRQTDVEDFAPEFCGLTAKPAGQQGRVRFEHGDLNSFRIPEGRFAAVVAWEALHHVHNVEGLIDQVKRGLRPDGLFIVHETVGQDVHGAGLCLLLTKRLVLGLVSRLAGGWPKPVPRASQEHFFSLFRRDFAAIPAPDELHSPFESVSGSAMIHSFKREFDVLHYSVHHHFLTEEAAFTIIRKWTEHLGFAPPLKSVTRFFRVLKSMDDLLLRFSGLKPHHAYLVLRPKKSRTVSVPVSLKEKAERVGGRPLGREEWMSSLLDRARRIQAGAPENLEGIDALRSFSAEEIWHGRLSLKDQDSGLMLLRGWYASLGDHRWTNGNASVFFQFPAGTGLLRVEMKGAPNASPENPQEVHFTIGDRSLGKIYVPQSGWKTYDLFLSDVPAGVVVINIRSGVFVPRDIGLSDMTQVQGVVLRSLQALPRLDS
jgi:2-polyprenyl-3-methyl-5-hydroxy-6-metoxy-1,4-benzoquinol methylase